VYATFTLLGRDIAFSAHEHRGIVSIHSDQRWLEKNSKPAPRSRLKAFQTAPDARVPAFCLPTQWSTNTSVIAFDTS